MRILVLLSFLMAALGACEKPTDQASVATASSVTEAPAEAAPADGVRDAACKEVCEKSARLSVQARLEQKLKTLKPEEHAEATKTSAAEWEAAKQTSKVRGELANCAQACLKSATTESLACYQAATTMPETAACYEKHNTRKTRP